MNRTGGPILAAFVVVCLYGASRRPAPVAAARQSPPAREIDTARSKMTVRVFKSGFFSAFAHNHEIDAPIASGEVQDSANASAPASATPANPSGVSWVELRVDARKMRVLDPDASPGTRAEVQDTMLGPQVLAADRFPEIHFKSASVEAKGTNSWAVRGNLDLHGQTHPVSVDVALKDGTYRGAAAVRPSAFGIKPISIAGGTVNVKDEVRIEFEIVLMNGASAAP
jgi:YceI-like domain